MNIAHSFNTRISTLVDTYQGSVPLARLILEAHHLERALLTLTLHEEEGDLFLLIIFSDGSEVDLVVTEEL